MMGTERDYHDVDGDPLLCDDCQRPAFYDVPTDRYHHAVDRNRGCFLIPGEDEPDEQDHPSVGGE